MQARHRDGVRRAAALGLCVALAACSGDAAAPDAGPADAGGIEDAAVDGGVCPSGSTRCDGVCVDRQVDEAHCGACNQACTAEEACLSGQCETVLRPVEPYVIDDGNRDCDTYQPFRGVAVDAKSRIHLGLICDGELMIARSVDQGQSFTIVPTGMTEVQGFRIHVGEGDELHLATITGPFFQGVMSYARSTDGGETWPRPRPVDLGPMWNAPYYFSEGFAVDGDDVYLTSRSVQDERFTKVWRSEGGGAFRLVHTIEHDMLFYEAEVFAFDGAVYVLGAYDNNLANRVELVYRSVDRGETFELFREIPNVGGRLRRRVGDRVYYADTNGLGLGYFSLAEGGPAEHFPIPGALIPALGLGLAGELSTIVNTGPPAGADHEPEFIVRFDTDTGEAVRTWLVPSLSFSDGRPYSAGYSNTALLEVPGTRGLIVAFSRDGDVNFRITEE